MNPLQINFAVHDLVAGVRFYSAMFAREPAVLKAGYAQWMLDEQRLSFTISGHDVSQCVIDLCGLCPNDAQLPTSSGPLTNTRKHHVELTLHRSGALHRQFLPLANGRGASEP
jgi:hypothetical protein